MKNPKTPPPAPTRKESVMHFRADDDLRRRVDAYAKKHKVSTSEVVRHSLKLLLEEV